jgi:hypothetical protein
MNVKLIGELYDDRPASTPAEEIPEVRPVEEPQIAVDEHSLLGLTELLLKEPARVDALAREEARQPELIPRFLAMAFASFSLFALALVLLFNSVDRDALPGFLKERWTGSAGPAVSLWLAYTFGLVAATGVCLPTFYFHSLLAGLRISVLQVTGHIMKGKASTSMMLLGILPIYVAIVLGMIVFHSPADVLEGALYLGLFLPFVAGLWGARAICRGVMSLADTLPADRRPGREWFLRWLTLAWAGCYTAVTPVMIYTLWDSFSGTIR